MSFANPSTFFLSLSLPTWTLALGTLALRTLLLWTMNPLPLLVAKSLVLIPSELELSAASATRLLARRTTASQIAVTYSASNVWQQRWRTTTVALAAELR